MSVPYSVRQVPLIGDTIYHAGQLYDLWATPCATTLRVEVEAFFAYAPTLIWAIVEPGEREIITERLGRSHRRKRKGRFKVYDYDMKLPVPSKGIYRIGWTIADAVNRVGFYLLIADATIDFLINWTSMVYVMSGCDVPNTPYAEITRRSPDRKATGIGRGWHLVGNYDHRAEANGFHAVFPNVTVSPNVPFSLSYGIGQGGGGGNIDGLRVQDNNGKILGQLGPNDRSGGNAFQGRTTFYFGKPDGFTLSMYVHQSTFTASITGQFLQAYGSLSYGLKPFQGWESPFKLHPVG